MRRFGFTLIELLVTIGIIAVLVAILIPALNMSRLQTKTTVCSSNIRQLSIALLAYSTDNTRFPYGFYNDPNMSPPEDGYAGIASYDRRGWWWFNYLEGLYKKSKGKQTVLQCPSKDIQNPALENDILCGNYGANLSICKLYQGKKNQKEFIGIPGASIDVTHPSRTLLLLDSGYAIISWWHAADNPPVTLSNSAIEDTAYVPGLKINKARHLLSAQNCDALVGRHPNRTINVGYIDGHVAILKADELLVEKNSDSYRNRSPMWVPQ